MKKNYILILISLLFTGNIEAQKEKIRDAEKELNSGNPQNAIAILKSVEYQVYNSNNDERAQYYFVQGSAYLALADKKIEESKNLISAAKSFKETIKIEIESGKRKYSVQIQNSSKSLKEKLEKVALKDSKEKKYIESANESYEAYLIDKKDTLNLFNAAANFANGKDYANALKNYEILELINYSGIETKYLATNRSSRTEEKFETNYDRDLALQAGTHEKPRTEKATSKRGEIYKNMAILYIQNGEKDKAKKVITNARMKNPEDNYLILAEADLALESKDFETYKKSIDLILKKGASDVNLMYNLAVLFAKANNTNEAETFYLKVISIDPQYFEAYANLSYLKLEGIATINQNMNKLGTSATEMEQYDNLKTKRDDLYKNVIPYLQKAIEINPRDEDTYQSLLSVYNALEMTEEYKQLKAKL